VVKWEEYIVSDPAVLLGKPCIKGTRLSVEFIVKLYASGWTEQMMFENYRRLTPESLRAVFAFIEECIKDVALFELPPATAA